MKSRLSSFVFSFILAAIIIGLCRWLLPGGWIYFLEVAGHFLFLGLAGLFIVLRLSFFVYREQFVYIYIGAFNLCLGMSSLLVFFIGDVNSNYPEMMSSNLLVGIIMLIDALLLKRKPYEQPIRNS